MFALELESGEFLASRELVHFVISDDRITDISSVCFFIQDITCFKKTYFGC